MQKIYLLYWHKFKKQGRTLSFNINTGMNGNNGESYLNSINSFLNSNIEETNSINQFAVLQRKGWFVSSNLTYTEPLGKEVFCNGTMALLIKKMNLTKAHIITLMHLKATLPWILH